MFYKDQFTWINYLIWYWFFCRATVVQDFQTFWNNIVSTSIQQSTPSTTTTVASTKTTRATSASSAMTASYAGLTGTMFALFIMHILNWYFLFKIDRGWKLKNDMVFIFIEINKSDADMKFICENYNFSKLTLYLL